MKTTAFFGGAFFALSSLALGQSLQRQALIRGGGGPNGGQCTIEVQVDKSAEVQIQGANATLRTTAGQPAQWRRFECTSVMPANPPNFHFAGVDGRGFQRLIRDPQSGGPAVIQIEDQDNGQEGYTFDVAWGGFNQGGYPPQQYPGGYRDNPNHDRPGNRDSDYFRRNGRGFAIEDAIGVCRDEVSRQAARRFASFNIVQTGIDNNPGRNDFVIGTLAVNKGRRGQQYNFSCSVDFNTGRVRSAQIDSRPLR